MLEASDIVSQSIQMLRFSMRSVKQVVYFGAMNFPFSRMYIFLYIFLIKSLNLSSSQGQRLQNLIILLFRAMTKFSTKLLYLVSCCLVANPLQTLINNFIKLSFYYQSNKQLLFEPFLHITRIGQVLTLNLQIITAVMRRNASSKTILQKNKTASSVILVQPQNSDRMKASSIRANVHRKMPTPSKISKGQAEKGQKKEKNMSKQNQKLREEICRLQNLQLKDKEKIKTLLGRISEAKQVKPTEEGNQQCLKNECEGRQKQIELKIYKQKLKIGDLEIQKKGWSRTREQMKTRYKYLLEEVYSLRQNR